MDIAAITLKALADQLEVPVEKLTDQKETDLEVLGLDSQGLMRVYLDIEKATGLEDLDLDDDALETPATMIASVQALVDA